MAIDNRTETGTPAPETSGDNQPSKDEHRIMTNPISLSEAEKMLSKVYARGTLRKKAIRKTIPASKIGERWFVDRSWLEAERQNPIPQIRRKQHKPRLNKRSLVARELARTRHDQDIAEVAGRILALRDEWGTKALDGDYLVPEPEWKKLDSFNLVCLAFHIQEEWPEDFEKMKGSYGELFKKDLPEEVRWTLNWISKKRMFEKECPVCHMWYS